LRPRRAGRGRVWGGIVAASIEDHDIEAASGVTQALNQLRRVDGPLAHVAVHEQLRTDRHEIIASLELNAVSGK